MILTVHYVFDPLCGWCYGAGAAVAAIAKSSTARLNLLPSGLFQDEGSREMDDAFAAYAWSNDQRIERQTGQRFSQRYREQVLANRTQRFDSGPATLALTAVARRLPEREAEALEAIQLARYVQGLDVTRTDVLASILGPLGLQEATQVLEAPDQVLQTAAQARIAEAKALMRRFGARGVPSFVLDSGGDQKLLQTNSVYSDPQGFLDQLAAA